MTDSRSSIQYLKNWPKIMDSTGLDILSKLVRPGQRKQVCLQWIPSHVGVPGNEAADDLAGRGCDLPNPSSTALTHSEIHSFQKNKMNLTWRNPPAQHWYSAKSPGLSIQCRSSRAHHQTALACFRSGHLRSMTFVQGVKSCFTCPCSLLASAAHLLDCWGISLRQLYEEKGLVCETITRKVPARHGDILNSSRAASPLVRLVKGEERWEASDHPQSVLPLNWGGIEPNRTVTVTCMVLKPTANDRRHLDLCHDEFRGPRSGLCRSGLISAAPPTGIFFTCVANPRSEPSQFV
ncbi:RNase H domain-containing protein [Trichonephila clavipes]|nr:RNase H domain-containing protein [Trichonephila clavipes]